MFTGIIEEKAKVVANELSINSSRLTILSTFEQVQAGESIAVNGVCLTALPTSSSLLQFDVSPETLAVTTLGSLSVQDEVNLERAMLASNRFGGHYVSGHVDTKALVHSINKMDEYIELELAGFAANTHIYLVPKGSLTVEGVSLTINALTNDIVSLMLVPHTVAQTTLGALKIGQSVNIEFDYLTRIVAHQLQLTGKVNSEVAP